MKKILFFVLITNFLSAQHPDLLNTNWKITKIVTELGPDQFPPGAPVENNTHFSVTAPNLSSTFFNSTVSDLTYIGNDSFNVNSRACTLADYMDDNGEVNQFFGKICSFYGGSGPFYYTIQNNGTEKTLVISTPTFESIHFSAATLGANDSKVSSFTFAPNPVEKSLAITHKTEIKSIAIFDLSGKLVYEQKNVNSKSLHVDMQNYKTGSYLIKINNSETFKILKQ